MEDIFGTIEAPEVISEYGADGGLILFLNNALQAVLVVGGLIVIYNIIMAGFTYLTAGSDSKAAEKVVTSLTNSLWGLALMLLAPALMAILGFFFFNDAMFFLTPTIQGPNP